MRETFKERQARRTQMGRHPLNGPPLYVDPEGVPRTCSDCRFHATREFARSYHKCQKYAQTAGPGTDIHTRWPACELYIHESKQDRKARLQVEWEAKLDRWAQQQKARLQAEWEAKLDRWAQQQKARLEEFPHV